MCLVPEITGKLPAVIFFGYEYQQPREPQINIYIVKTVKTVVRAHRLDT